MSSELISQIGQIAHEAGALLIVDETNTGCGATGNFWAYNGDQADYVTFGKRTQATGYYHNSQGGIQLGGSEHNVALLDIINNEIKSSNLCDRVQKVGASL